MGETFAVYSISSVKKKEVPLGFGIEKSGVENFIVEDFMVEKFGTSPIADLLWG